MSIQPTTSRNGVVVVRVPVPDSTGYVSKVNIDGCDAYVLQNARVSATVVPERGARIVSLIDVAKGYEWMWRPISPIRLPARVPGDPFDTGPLVGADECVPTVGPCDTGTAHYPDHGDAWARAWAVDVDESAGIISTRLDLECAPIRVERMARLHDSSLVLGYRFENRSNADLPWLWSWHPLLTLPAQPRLRLRGFAPDLRPDNGEGVPLDDAWQWPVPFPGADLSELDLGAEGRSVKLFARRTDVPADATLTDAQTGASLTVALTGTPLRAMGLWINRGGWSGFQHVALEPTTVGLERPTDQGMSSTPAVLKGGAVVSFEFPITLGD